MNSNKGTLITVIVVLAVVLLGIVLWWMQMSNVSTQPGLDNTSSTSSTIIPAENDTTDSIQADLNAIDTGSSTQDLQSIDSDIDSL